MKHIFINFLITLFSINLYSQINNWEWINPKPSGYSGVEIIFISRDTGYIINDKEILITTDSGETWIKLRDIYSSNDIDFYYSTGFIVGNNGYAIKSIDNGLTWQEINIEIDYDLLSVDVICKDTIIISSRYGILNSIDGGENWNYKPLNLGGISKALFINSKIGHYIGNADRIFKTVDGGDNWYMTEGREGVSSSNGFYDIFFINNLIGYATKENTYTYKTINGGETWSIINENMDVGKMYFINENVGYATGDMGHFFKTTDGGINWNFVSYGNINSIYFIDNTTGYCAGSFGKIMKTIDGGITWKDNSFIDDELLDMSDFFDSTIYAISRYKLIKSEDMGNTWEILELTPIEQTFSNCVFVNKDTGFVSEDWGTVYKTTDGGKTWKTVLFDPGDMMNIKSINFINSDTGFLNGGYAFYYTYITIDGGEIWTEVNQDTKSLDKLVFLDKSTGFGLTNYDDLFKTENGGKNWTEVIDEYDVLNDFCFANSIIGYAVGINSKLLKTNDGGLNWDTLDFEIYTHFKIVNFINKDTGIIVSDDNMLYTTINGGISWTEEKIPFSSSINSVKFINTEYLLFVGYSGNIFRKKIDYDNLATIENNFNAFDFKYIVFPNPTKNIINIDFQCEDYYYIKLLDMSGKICLNKKVYPKAQINLSHLQNGLYILSVKNKNNIWINRKIIKY